LDGSDLARSHLLDREKYSALCRLSQIMHSGKISTVLDNLYPGIPATLLHTAA
jgi:hypothetical protein